MNHIVVSFCIATFRRYDILRELLTEILSVDNDQFEVVVCDDCSADGSINRIKQIQDRRLRIYINNTNVGSMQNIYEALSKGRGKYLFYINDRDNVDCFKIKELIDLLNELEKKEVAFIKCAGFMKTEKYQIFYSGKDAILEFACRVAHPTGYIYLKSAWDEIENLNLFFEKQYDSDYPASMVCAVMALKYNGAYLYGDICDVSRKRIDFTTVKSGYYLKRKDKRIWYSPEVQWRELVFGYGFLKRLHVQEEILEEFLFQRYGEYLKRVLIQYKNIVSKPENTVHYKLKISRNSLNICIKALQNGLYMWTRMYIFCKSNKKTDLLKKINKNTRLNYTDYFTDLYKEVLRRI